MKTFDETRNYFISLCVHWHIPQPKICPALASDPCDYTSAKEVRINVQAAPDVDAEWHAAHVFGHYLACFHAEADLREDGAVDTDLIADAIAWMATRRSHELV